MFVDAKHVIKVCKEEARRFHHPDGERGYRYFTVFKMLQAEAAFPYLSKDKTFQNELTNLRDKVVDDVTHLKKSFYYLENMDYWLFQHALSFYGALGALPKPSEISMLNAVKYLVNMKQLHPRFIDIVEKYENDNDLNIINVDV